MDNINLDNAMRMELEQKKILALLSNITNCQLIKEIQMDNIA